MRFSTGRDQLIPAFWPAALSRSRRLRILTLTLSLHDGAEQIIDQLIGIARPLAHPAMHVLVDMHPDHRLF
jgi:hypothetical protein